MSHNRESRYLGRFTPAMGSTLSRVFTGHSTGKSSLTEIPGQPSAYFFFTLSLSHAGSPNVSLCSMVLISGGLLKAVVIKTDQRGHFSPWRRQYVIISPFRTNFVSYDVPVAIVRSRWYREHPRVLHFW